MNQNLWTTDCEENADGTAVWFVLRGGLTRYSVEWLKKANGHRVTFPSEHAAEMAAADLNKSISR